VKVVEAKVLRDRDFTEAEASKILAAALAPQGVFRRATLTP
jgi:hypothetical protein